jgi:hypothetical protein
MNDRTTLHVKETPVKRHTPIATAIVQPAAKP